MMENKNVMQEKVLTTEIVINEVDILPASDMPLIIGGCACGFAICAGAACGGGWGGLLCGF